MRGGRGVINSDIPTGGLDKFRFSDTQIPTLPDLFWHFFLNSDSDALFFTSNSVFRCFFGRKKAKSDVLKNPKPPSAILIIGKNAE